MKEKYKLWVFIWTIGLLAWLVFLILKITGRVKIRGYEKRKVRPGASGLILIANHPSLWEPAILPFLFFPRCLFSQKLLPISVVDKNDYYNKIWFSPFRMACLPVERGNAREELKAMDAMIEILNQGRILILYPEGGRTSKGEEFKFSCSGRKIRRFKKGLRRLFLNSHAVIWPVWTEGGDKVMPRFSFPHIWAETVIKPGEPFKPEARKSEILEVLEGVLLELGDR